ncbi:LysM domain-containing GPI-anchored protein 2 [Senna tora]|uniref:LysM domain-containing GPI-anchored protein 2 n=1 Tax=Senna tora TaxID=362788 RepID=A0A834SXE8_9FABA|nr:LysM domain-containing GPI-anchored protein 2 [Senna tora]
MIKEDDVNGNEKMIPGACTDSASAGSCRSGVPNHPITAFRSWASNPVGSSVYSRGGGGVGGITAALDTPIGSVHKGLGISNVIEKEKGVLGGAVLVSNLLKGASRRDPIPIVHNLCSVDVIAAAREWDPHLLPGLDGGWVGYVIQLEAIGQSGGVATLAGEGDFDDVALSHRVVPRSGCGESVRPHQLHQLRDVEEGLNVAQSGAVRGFIIHQGSAPLPFTAAPKPLAPRNAAYYDY